MADELSPITRCYNHSRLDRNICALRAAIERTRERMDFLVRKLGRHAYHGCNYIDLFLKEERQVAWLTILREKSACRRKRRRVLALPNERLKAYYRACERLRGL